MIVDTTKINGIPLSSLAPVATGLTWTVSASDAIPRSIFVSGETGKRMIAHHLSDADVERLIIAHLDAHEPKQE